MDIRFPKQDPPNSLCITAVRCKIEILKLCMAWDALSCHTYACLCAYAHTHTHESPSLECTPVLYVHAHEPVSVCDCVFTACPCRYACLCSQPVPRGLIVLQTVLLALLTSCCSGQHENIAQRVFSRQSFAVSSLSWVTLVQIISQSVSILNKKRYSYQNFIFHMSGTYTCLYKEPFSLQWRKYIPSSIQVEFLYICKYLCYCNVIVLFITNCSELCIL